MKRLIAPRLLLVLLMACWCGGAAVGQIRPQTPQLLPRNTVALLTIPDVQRVLPRLAETNLGQMLQQPGLEPWAQELSGWMGRVVDSIGNRAGVDARELGALFRGEVSIALVDRAEEPALVILVDFAEDRTRVDEILATIEKTLVAQGARLGSAQVAGVPVRLIEREAARTERLYYVVLENTLLSASHPDVLEQLLTSWVRIHRRVDSRAEENASRQGPSAQVAELGGNLQDVPGFTALLAECQKLQKERPLAFWYVDPINFLRTVGQNDPNIQFGLIMVPILGLDALTAVGGAISAAIGPLDWFTQTHVLLSGSRGGALGLLSFSAGDYTPPQWVPAETTNYLSLNWRVDEGLEAIRTILDGFRGRGALSAELKRISNRLGVDIEGEVLPLLTGRIVGAALIEWPARRESRAQLLGLEVRDPQQAEKLLARMVERLGPSVTEERFAQYRFYHMQRPRRSPGGQFETEDVYFGLIGSWVMGANRRGAYERAIGAFEGTFERLAQTEEFRQLAARIDERVDPLSLALVTYENTRENTRYMFELAQTEEGRRMLEEAAGRQRIARVIRNLINRQGLPPFSLVEKYLVPQGSILISDATGLHYVTFSFRVAPEEEGASAQPR